MNDEQTIEQLRNFVRAYGTAKTTEFLLQASKINAVGYSPEAVIHRDIESLENCTIAMLNNHPLRKLAGRL